LSLKEIIGENGENSKQNENYDSFNCVRKGKRILKKWRESFRPERTTRWEVDSPHGAAKWIIDGDRGGESNEIYRGRKTEDVTLGPKGGQVPAKIDTSSQETGVTP